MGKANKVGRKIVWLANEFINICVLIAILLLLGFGSYALWDYSQVFNSASAKQYDIYRPTAETGGEQLSFEELTKINPEVISWITIYGTNIDYPIAQAKDNLKYINTNAKGEYALTGSIFLDTHCSPDFSDFSSIIYGHHMDEQVMFGEIGSFTDKQYFDARKYGELYYGGKYHGLEFFAFLHADAYDTSVFRTNIDSELAQEEYLKLIAKRAKNIRNDVTVTVKDKIVLLSTCSGSSTNGRDILIAKITDTIYENTFKTASDNPKASPIIRGGIPGLWGKTPLWGKIGYVALPFLIIILTIVLIYKKKQRLKKEKK